MVSRVGQDDLGREVVEQLRERGMDTSYLQTDPDQPTGKVYVKKDASGRRDLRHRGPGGVGPTVV